MATTFSVGSTAFAALDSGAAGRYALWWRPAASKLFLKRFHPPGVDGNLIVRGGRESQGYELTFRYIGSESVVTGYFDTDEAAWVAAEQTLTGPDYATHTRCNLTDMVIVSPPMGVGGGLLILDVKTTFMRDG